MSYWSILHPSTQKQWLLLCDRDIRPFGRVSQAALIDEAWNERTPCIYVTATDMLSIEEYEQTYLILVRLNSVGWVTLKDLTPHMMHNEVTFRELDFLSEHSQDSMYFTLSRSSTLHSTILEEKTKEGYMKFYWHTDKTLSLRYAPHVVRFYVGLDKATHDIYERMCLLAGTFDDACFLYEVVDLIRDANGVLILATCQQKDQRYENIQHGAVLLVKKNHHWEIVGRTVDFILLMDAKHIPIAKQRRTMMDLQAKMNTIQTELQRTVSEYHACFTITQTQ